MFETYHIFFIVDPPTCSDNEVYSECGAHGCLNTCKEPNLITICDPAPGCYPGCICAKGYLRDENGKCVLPTECSTFPECPFNEQYSACGAGCQNRCDYIRQGIAIACLPDCVSGCICNSGFVRDDNGICVPEEQCQPISTFFFLKFLLQFWNINSYLECPENEFFSTCYSECKTTCDNYYKDVFCPDVCQEGCFCEVGYVRDENGKCIPIDDCPERKKFI